MYFNLNEQLVIFLDNYLTSYNVYYVNFYIFNFYINICILITYWSIILLGDKNEKE